MIDKGLYRKNFRGGGADMGAGASGMGSGNSAPGPGDTGGEGGYGPQDNSTSQFGGGGEQFDAPGTLSDIREKQDYFGPTAFGPARKFTGSFLDNIFGGGYRPVTPSGNFQSRFSQMGGLGKGILGSLIGSALGIPGIIASIPSGIQTLGSRFSDSRLGNYLSNLNEKLQKDFSVAGTYVPEEDEDEVETIDIRDKYNRLGIMDPDIRPTQMFNFDPTQFNTRNRDLGELVAEITQKDIDASKARGFKMLDRDTAVTLGLISPNVTEYEFEQLKQGNITEPGTYIG